jgi:hypothetical protein
MGIIYAPIISDLPVCDEEVWRSALDLRMGMMTTDDTEGLERIIASLDGPLVFDLLCEEYRLRGEAIPCR